MRLARLVSPFRLVVFMSVSTTISYLHMHEAVALLKSRDFGVVDWEAGN
jgi:hypothetical protein